MIRAFEYLVLARAISNLGSRISRAIDEATAHLDGGDEPDEPCPTCGGLGELAHAELVSGPNLPPGGFYDSGDDTYPCPDCQTYAND